VAVAADELDNDGSRLVTSEDWLDRGWVVGTRLWGDPEHLHRGGAAVVECPDGRREWWRDGERHRIDGDGRKLTIEWEEPRVFTTVKPVQRRLEGDWRP
jgi:hypothetical protein